MDSILSCLTQCTKRGNIFPLLKFFCLRVFLVVVFAWLNKPSSSPTVWSILHPPLSCRILSITIVFCTHSPWSWIVMFVLNTVKTLIVSLHKVLMSFFFLRYLNHRHSFYFHIAHRGVSSTLLPTDGISLCNTRLCH